MVNPVRNSGSSLNPTRSGSKRNPASRHRSIIDNRVKAKYVLIALILIAIGIGVSLTLFQSEAKKVKKQFHLLSEGVSKDPGESIFTMDQKIKKIGSLFRESCEINIPAYSVSGLLARDEITGYAARGRLYVAELQLKFYDFNIVFPKEDETKVRLTARLTGKTINGEMVNEAHELDCLLKRIEKRWLFDRIEVVEVLKK